MRIMEAPGQPPDCFTVVRRRSHRIVNIETLISGRILHLAGPQGPRRKSIHLRNAYFYASIAQAGLDLDQPQTDLNRLIHAVHASGTGAPEALDQPLAVDGTDLVQDYGRPEGQA